MWPGFHLDPAGRAYSAGYMGLTYKGRGGESRGEGRRCERKGCGEGEGSRGGRKGKRRERVISVLLFPTSSPGLE